MAENPNVRIVTPDGKLHNPASCWVVELTWDDEKEYLAELERSGQIGRTVERFGGGDLIPHLAYPEAHRG